MRYLIPVFLFLFAASLNLPGQNGAPPAGGARSIGMGLTGLTYHDVNAVFSNPAGLSSLQTAAATAFGEQRFLVDALGVYAFGLGLPTSAGTFGVSVQHFGFEGYNEQRFGLAYGRQLSDKLSIGAQFLGLNTQIAEYGSRFVLTFEAGMQVQLLPELELAAHINSPARIEVVDGQYLPTLLSIGARYNPSKQVSLLLEAQKDIDHPVRTKVGVEYQVAAPFYLRFGAATNPAMVTLGIGYKIADRLLFDVASGYHEILGFSPAGGIRYQF